LTARFALATARDIHPNGPEEDALIVAALEARGAAARTIIWDEAEPATLRDDIVVIRTPWNYTEKFDAFIAWLKDVDKVATLINPLDHHLATIFKTYLGDYAARGYAVPEARVCRSERELTIALHDPAFADAVLKPVVGGGAIGLRRIRAKDPGTWTNVDYRVPQLLQRFVPEIETAGELSFVFFGGVFSHAVRKRGKPGDIRVQVDWGGTVEVIAPSPHQVAEAAHFLTALPSVPAYARVDVVEAAGKLLLMELEVIEPELFCLYVPGSAERFAQTLLSTDHNA
jgi:glutathione synthase/RimK-type ligase-like ATP-grasp enzyme